MSSSAKWENDDALQREVYLGLVKALKRDALPGFDWVKKAIKGCPNGDWADSTVRQDNIGDITKAAQKRASPKGVDLEKAEFQQKSFSTTSPGHAYKTAEVMREAVEEIRLKYWGKTTPPFSADKQGYDEAFQWLRAQERDDLKQTLGRIPAPFSITLNFTGVDYQILNCFLLGVVAEVKAQERGNHAEVVTDAVRQGYRKVAALE